eukprot:335694-Hanusia_phi.AAC.10
MRLWLTAYSPVSPQDWFVVLEDDTEVSPFWVRWLIPALAHYRMDSSVFGVCLSKPVERGKDPLGLGDIAASVPSGTTAIKYRMPCTEGLAPLPKNWEAFRRWLARVTDADPAFDPTQTEEIDVRDLRVFQRYRELRAIRRESLLWQAMLVRYTFEVAQYTAYPWTASGASLARSWQEAGPLNRHTRGPREDLLSTWEPELLRWNPRTGTRLDYTGRGVT